MRILAVESSCDETSVAIVEDGKKILSNIVLSQIDIHRQWCSARNCLKIPH